MIEPLQIERLTETGAPLKRLTLDLKKAATTMTRDEARYLVDSYYQRQNERIRAAGQIRATDGKEPHATLDWVLAQSESLEESIKGALGAYAASKPVGAWSQSICGIGPVLSAGLLAYIDIEKAHVAGAIWRYAGYDPTLKWLGVEGSKKLVGDVLELTEEELMDDHFGALSSREVDEVERLLGNKEEIGVAVLFRIAQMTNRTLNKLTELARNDEGVVTKTSLLKALAKRPWNAKLKCLSWKIGQSFVKVSSNKNDFYGKLLLNRKMIEIHKNDSGDFAAQAIGILSSKKIGRTTDAFGWYAGCYPSGTMSEYASLPSEKRQGFLNKRKGEPGSGMQMLPPAHIQARSERWAVKLFLSHWQQVAFRAHFGRMAPKPYVLDVLGHKDEIQVPNWPWAKEVKEVTEDVQSYVSVD